MSAERADEKAVATCRHCGLEITRHQGIGGLQWRDLSKWSPSVCLTARSGIHKPRLRPPTGGGDRG